MRNQLGKYLPLLSRHSVQTEKPVMVLKICDVVKAIRRESVFCSPVLNNIDDAALDLSKPANSYYSIMKACIRVLCRWTKENLS